MSSMNFLRIAARVALAQPLSDQPDYGSREMITLDSDESDNSDAKLSGSEESK